MYFHKTRINSPNGTSNTRHHQTCRLLPQRSTRHYINDTSAILAGNTTAHKQIEKDIMTTGRERPWTPCCRPCAGWSVASTASHTTAERFSSASEDLKLTWRLVPVSNKERTSSVLSREYLGSRERLRHGRRQLVIGKWIYSGRGMRVRCRRGGSSSSDTSVDAEREMSGTVIKLTYILYRPR